MPTWLIVLIIVLVVIVGLTIVGMCLEDDDPKKKSKTKRIDGNKYHNIYRTKDGKSYYLFRYVPMPYSDKFYIDIVSQPSYNGRCSDADITHRLTCERPGASRKICIYDSEAPRSLEAAMKISADWAELTNTYIKTGKTKYAQLARR